MNCAECVLDCCFGKTSNVFQFVVSTNFPLNDGMDHVT